MATRFCVPKIKHFNTNQVCITASTGTFIFAITIICIPKHVSLVFSGLVGIVIPLIMYAESLLFNPNSPEDTVRLLCKNHGYNELKTEIAVRFFALNEKPKDVWLWLLETKQSDIEWDTVRHLKWKMKKELYNP